MEEEFEQERKSRAHAALEKEFSVGISPVIAQVKE